MATKSLTFELFGHDRTASAAIRGVGDAGEHMGRVLGVAAFGVGAALGAATAAVAAFSVDSIKAFAEAETAQTKLAFAFEKFPTLAGGNIQALRDLDTQLQKTTRFEDDATAAAQGTLAMYDLTSDQLIEITPLLLDYAAATGKTATDAAEDLGKAILGQGRSLKAIGLNFKDAGNQTDNYTNLIAGLRTQVQGFAEKDAQTVSGRLDILNNQFNDIQEKWGAAFAPALTLATDVINESLLPGLDQVISRVGPELEDALADLAPKFNKAVNASLPAIERLANALPGALSGLADSISADFGPAGIFGGTGPDGVVTQAFDIINSTIEKNKQYGFDWGRQWEAQGRVWGLLWDGIADDVTTSSNQMKARWRQSLYDMKADVYNSGIQSAGWEFAQGFADGITSNAEAAASAAEQMALRTVRRVRTAMQIQSPSKVMRDLGSYIPQGFAMGIEDEMWRVDSAFADMAPTSSSMSVAARVPSGGGGTHVVVNVSGAVGNEDFLAKTVVRAIQNSRNRGQTSRTALA